MRHAAKYEVWRKTGQVRERASRVFAGTLEQATRTAAHFYGRRIDNKAPAIRLSAVFGSFDGTDGFQYEVTYNIQSKQRSRRQVNGKNSEE